MIPLTNHLSATMRYFRTPQIHHTHSQHPLPSMGSLSDD